VGVEGLRALAVERFLPAALRVDVGARADPLADGAVGLEHRHAADLEVAVAAVAHAHAHHVLVARAIADGLLPSPRHLRLVVRMDEGHPAEFLRLVLRLAGQLGPGWRDGLQRAARSGCPDDLRAGVDGRPPAISSARSKPYMRAMTSLHSAR